MRTASDIILTIPSSPIPLTRFKGEFLSLYADAAKGTVEKLRQAFRLIEGLGCEGTDQLTPELIARLIASRPKGQSPHTTRGLLMQVRTLCSYAEARRYVSVSPFRIRRLAQWIKVGQPTGKRHQSAHEIRRILGIMGRDVENKKGWAQWRARRLYALTATVGYTGLRAREAQRLHLEDLDLDHGVINVVPRTPNGRLKTEYSAQPVCAPAALVPILREWLDHRLDHPTEFPMPRSESIPWLFPGSKRISAWIHGEPGRKPVERLKAVARRAGIEGVTFQSLRRSWATIAEGLGVPQAMITRQLRHGSEETTKRWYQQRDLEILKQSVSGFEFPS